MKAQVITTEEEYDRTLKTVEKSALHKCGMNLAFLAK
jgi:hypothetical protein